MRGIYTLSNYLVGHGKVFVRYTLSFEDFFPHTAKKKVCESYLCISVGFGQKPREP